MVVVRAVGTSERKGRKRKERKNACSGEPHGGAGEDTKRVKRGREWV
jgi:hypothetical protein